MSKKKRKKIIWTPEAEKTGFKHEHLLPREKGEELLIHKAFKK